MKLFKKALPLCLLALALVIGFAALTPKAQAAANGTCGENVTWTLTDAGKLTISGTGDMEEFAWAGAPWYEVRDAVKTVVIEDGVTSVAPYAFFRCYKLETAKLPEGIVSIGKSAFEGCTAMKSVNFGSSLTTIGKSAFMDCSKLTKLTFPLSVTRIEGGAFYNCTAMQEVYIADPLAWCKIDFEDRNSNPMQYAYFMYLHGGQDIYSIRLDETVTEIPAFAFKGCSFLSSVSMPETVTSIGEGAFYACSSLGSFTMPKAVTFIGTDAFALCDNLRTLHVSDVGAWAQIEFENPGANPMLNSQRMTVNGQTLTSAEIPEGVTAISDYAFYWCSYLKDIYLPESLTAIGEYAFASCTSLENVYYAGSESQWSSITIGDGNRFLENAAITCNYGAGDFTGDETVSNEDVVLLLWHTLFPEEYPVSAAADLNKDGTVDNEDVVVLLWHTLFPEENPL